MENVLIVSAARTPIGTYGGSLKDMHVSKYTALVLNESVQRANVESTQVDDVIMGQSYQNGECANGARMAVFDAGWSDSVPGVTLDRCCCSGLDAIFIGVMKIQTGNADIIVAGGMDSMSQAELYVPGHIKWGLGGKMDEKWGFMPKGHGALPMWGLPLFDRIQRARVMSQPIERFGELSSMMTWAEAAAKNEGISREDADQWSLRSQQKAENAMASGAFNDEIVPVTIPQRKGDPLIVDKDEHPRAGSTIDGLQKLRPIVKQDGTVLPAMHRASTMVPVPY